jgi:thiazole tautomerase (transcriptional regulator TenI)
VPRSVVLTPDVLDPRLLANALVAWVGSVDAVILRFRGWPDRTVYEVASRLAELPQRPALLLSDRFDIAAAAGCEGVQLRESSLPPDAVRAIAPHLLIGVSRHDVQGLRASAGADFALLGPVFPTSSKPQQQGIGLSGLQAVLAHASLPVLALGGIHGSRIEACLRAGAHGVALLSAVWSSRDPILAGRKLGALVRRGL